VQDSSQIDGWIAETLAAHPGEVARFKGGEAKLIGFLTGQVMKRSKGKADPKAVGAALAKALGS
jgi:aspartyl-tRNA(Asn)/glutamyl-tRNA(Gln) amidotransferase subunit B